MDYNSYEEVLNGLDAYFDVRIKDESYRNSLKKIVAGSREEKTVTIRAIYEEFMEYMKEYRDVESEIPGDRELWTELLARWQ
ncbi:hypothetical protein QM637_15590 [Pantoea allii]|uniref:hypothetical protein n=1 Tax=Pantoea allii TaxID=574096 RepID=UPI0024B65A6B|nr:hypothetical protein [Pantoea allii]MDJ0037243.1 hypothetical protein [Pantoea allii]